MDLALFISIGVLIGCFVGLSWFAGEDAPFVPTRMSSIKKVLQNAGVKKGKKFYELGSGDGRVVFEAAKLGAFSTGIEQSWIRILYSKWRASQQKLTNIKLIHGNIFKKNYQDADIIYIYLLPKGIVKLETKLKKELKRGSVIITQTFHFQNWIPFKKFLLKDGDYPNVFLGPSKMEGDFWIYRV
jgi:SAM-dependent methyltransferase